jgi:hypothetical protein
MAKDDKGKAGRPTGSMNKLSQDSIRLAKESGELPHEFLLRVARGEPIMRTVIDKETGWDTQVQEVYDFEQRKDAAKAAAPYFAPKISTVEVIRGVPDDELDRIIAQLASETGVGTSTGGEEPSDEGQDIGGGPTPRVKLQRRA